MRCSSRSRASPAGPLLPVPDTRKHKRELLTGPLPDEENAPLGDPVQGAVRRSPLARATRSAPLLARRVDVLTKERMVGLGFGGGGGGGSGGVSWGAGVGLAAKAAAAGAAASAAANRRTRAREAAETEKQCAQELAGGRLAEPRMSSTALGRFLPRAACPRRLNDEAAARVITDHACEERLRVPSPARVAQLRGPGHRRGALPCVVARCAPSLVSRR